jgi:hypothetical protein
LRVKRIKNVAQRLKKLASKLHIYSVNYAVKPVHARGALSSTNINSHQETVSNQACTATLLILIELFFFFLVEEFLYGTQYQSGFLLLLINVGSGFHCLLVSFRKFFPFFPSALWINLWLAKTSHQPISQTMWLKVIPHCNHCKKQNSTLIMISVLYLDKA